jgi:hypothetical protein
MGDFKIVFVSKSNLSEHEPTCFLNPKNKGYQIKREWLKDRFDEGLQIKLLYVDDEKKPVGYIEYVPGEYAWRAVDAKGYLFIHCIWISKNKYKGKGFASELVKECEKDSKSTGKFGVAVITSEGPFMAGKDMFLKNGYKSVASVNPSYELLVKSFNDGPKPKIKDWQLQLKDYQGLNIIYSKQCPWVVRFISELKDSDISNELDLRITELKTPEQAQNAPSIYATFNLIYNGTLLADHYISKTRFNNIIKKEIK